MFRLARSAAWWALAGACLMQPARALSPPQMIALSASVLKVEVTRRQGGYSLGSGVLVADQRVLTNCHVTRDAVAIAVMKDGLRQPVQAQAVDAEHDLCLLRVDSVRGEGLPLADSLALRDGRKVTALGYTGGLGLSSSDGVVVGVHPLDGGAVIQSSNGFNSGASGGALLDEQLRLVGILTFRLRGGDAHYFSSPSEWARRLLADTTLLQPVQPDDGGIKPYWLKPEAQQADFLRAQSLLRGRRWADLRALAQQWSRRARSDPQPAFLLGQAEEGLEQMRDALGAFEDAVARDDGYAGAWLRVGLLSHQLGLAERARQALRALERLNPEIAATLAAVLAGSAPAGR
jgi:serine protease Do